MDQQEFDTPDGLGWMDESGWNGWMEWIGMDPDGMGWMDE